jgi:hypothetical protein
MKETIITARMHKDGMVVEVLPDGSFSEVNSSESVDSRLFI